MSTGTTGGKQQAPGVPDYMGAANLMGQQSLYNTQYQTYANRPDITTPEGSIRWTSPEYTPPAAGVPSTGLDATGGTAGSGTSGRPGRDGGAGAQPIGTATDLGVAGAGGAGGTEGGGGYAEPGRWGMEVTLSPERQAAYDAQNRLSAARSGLGETLFGRAQTELGTPADWGSLSDMPDAESARQQAINANYEQASSRLDPQWGQRESQLQAQLLNQGLRPGMEAYDTQMANLGRERNDAYTSAMRSSILAGEPVASGEFGRGLQSRQQGINELLTRRGSTLNEINALLGGQQVNMPTSPGFSQAGAAATPDYTGALGQQYNAQMNAYNVNAANAAAPYQYAAGLAPLFFGF